MPIPYRINNLVLEGYGVGAIAYAGFFKKIEESSILKLNQITRVAGVSSGGIAAMQVALNYSAEEMINGVKNQNFSKFADAPGGFIADIIRLFTEEGIYKAEYLYCYLRKLIKAKTGNEYITFYDLQMMKSQYHFKDLYLVATKLFMIDNKPSAQAFIFSHEHTPHARVVDAVRASASIPLIFPPMRLREEKDGKYSISSGGDVYVDGGYIEAYPLTIFDHSRYLSETEQPSEQIIYNSETLGLMLDDKTDISLLEKNHSLGKREKKIKNNFEYARALLYVLTRGQQNAAFINNHDRKRTIFIDTLGIPSTDFNLNNKQINTLLKSGENAAEKFMKHTDYTNNINSG